MRCAGVPTFIRSSGARTAAPARSRGFSDENGSWKMICMRAPRLAQRLALERAEVGVAEPHRARVTGDRRITASAVVVLPEPDSPTTASVLPRRIVEGHAVDRLHDFGRA